MMTTVLFSVALGADPGTVLVLDGSRSVGEAGWAQQRTEALALLDELGDAPVAIATYAAAAEWLVRPWTPAAEAREELATSVALEHGSELGYALEFAVNLEPRPTRVVAWTDGLLPGGREARAPDGIELRVVSLPDPAGGDPEAARAWLADRVAEAVARCVPKARHQRRLPETLSLETTRAEVVALDLGETAEDHRYCLASAVGEWTLAPAVAGLERLTTAVSLRP